MSAQKILLGTVSGIVAGIALGLLVAPAKGSDTRQKISDAAENLKRKIRDLRGKTIDELDELKEIFERETTGLKEDVRERVLTLIKAAKTSTNNIKEEAMS
ncbi:MAG TPA: YtxH domain-containing protein [Puia sp.]|nr:YtxH domain-containing protein [Puia sp.]